MINSAGDAATTEVGSKNLSTSSVCTNVLLATLLGELIRVSSVSKQESIDVTM